MNNGTGELEGLYEKEKALRERIARAKAKQQQREAKNRKRLAEIIGNAMVREAEKYPDFREKFKQALNESVTDEKERQFLKERGWL
jgi:hypothetical protein